MAKKSSKPSAWRHPVHARGVRSPRFDVRGGELLDDDRIDHYTRLGYYGTEKQNALLSQDKKGKKVKRKAKPVTLAAALKALGAMK